LTVPEVQLPVPSLAVVQQKLVLQSLSCVQDARHMVLLGSQL
jgi:hypothetical protein